MTINRITFLEDIIPNNIFAVPDPKLIRFYFNDSFEIARFLFSLDLDKTYVVSFEFVYSWLLYEEDGPFLTLSKPILVTRESNPKIISAFILEKLNLAINAFYLDDSIIYNDDDNYKLDGPGIIVKYKEIRLF